MIYLHQYDTMGRPISGKPEVRRAAKVNEWRIEHAGLDS